MNGINWPEGKDFAFTIFDDTDLSTIKNVKEVYSLLIGYGFYTTKSVWPIRGTQKHKIGGSTCEDPEYLDWIMSIKNAGVEIALHNVTFHNSIRRETIRGIEMFHSYFGHYPKSMSNHSSNVESIYWGNFRITGLNKFIYNLLTLNRHNGIFLGHIEGDQYFWGDLCKEKIKYIRNFVYSGINTLKACPIMPYHDPKRPFVNYWFASSEGPDVNTFNQCISEKNQDALEEEGGACIMYTHLANGFYENNSINSRFKFLIKRFNEKNGWFVPVSTLLDYLLKAKGHHEISDEERKHLERKWLLHKIKTGSS